MPFLQIYMYNSLNGNLSNLVHIPQVKLGIVQLHALLARLHVLFRLQLDAILRDAGGDAAARRRLRLDDDGLHARARAHLRRASTHSVSSSLVARHEAFEAFSAGRRGVQGKKRRPKSLSEPCMAGLTDSGA